MVCKGLFYTLVQLTGKIHCYSATMFIVDINYYNFKLLIIINYYSIYLVPVASLVVLNCKTCKAES